MAGSVDAFIALGSNLGDRLPQLERARSALGGTAGIRVVAASRIYETEPVGPAGQGPYLNAVLAVETRLGSRPGRGSGDSTRWNERTLIRHPCIRWPGKRWIGPVLTGNCGV